MGEAIFYYPVTCNPLIALAGTTILGGNAQANDAVITELGTTSCKIDSTAAEYKSAYKVIVIGQN